MRMHRSLWAAVVLFTASASQATVISYSGSIVQFIAPANGTYDITAVGAAGGAGDSDFASNSGGLGASVHATFSLTSGQVLDILVGQIGSAGPSGGAGGGGGTYVVIHGGAPLLIAGAGGGAVVTLVAASGNQRVPWHCSFPAAVGAAAVRPILITAMALEAAD